MKKTYHIIWVSVLCVISLCACATDPMDETNGVQIPVEFDTGIVSRATDQAWESGDRIGIFMVAGGQRLSAGSVSANADNKEYTVAAGNPSKLTAVSGDLFFPINRDQVDFIGYYPYREPLADYTYAVQTADQRDAPATDLLYSDDAKGKSNAEPQVRMTFRHMMSRVSVNVQLSPELAGLGVGSVTLRGFATDGVFSLADGAWTVGGTGDISGFVTGTHAVAHLIPQGAASGRTIVIEVDGDLSIYALPDDRDLPAGRTVVCNLTVGREGVTEALVTIDDWEEGSLADQSVAIPSASQIEVVWPEYHDEDFTAIEILDNEGNLYSTTVSASDGGGSMTTDGLLGAETGTIYVDHVRVIYLGRRFEIPDDRISFADGRLRIDYHGIVAKENHLRYISEHFLSEPELLAGEYIQISDIDLRSEEFTPIGKYKSEFRGIYDGGGYKIDNLWIHQNQKDDAGLFGYCMNGILRNIHIGPGEVYGRNQVGGVCGSMEVRDGGKGEIAGCSNEAMVGVYGSSGGGICGDFETIGTGSVGSVTGCSNRGNVVLINHNHGGICGSIQAIDGGRTTVKDCYNYAEITGDYQVGGIAGIMNAENGIAEITDCHNKGRVLTTYYIGGICGICTSQNGGKTTIRDCTNTHDISATMVSVSGICGSCISHDIGSISEIIGCRNMAEIQAPNKNLGCICGSIHANNNGTVKITRCLNAGKGDANTESGGICGFAVVSENGIIEVSQCINTGPLHMGPPAGGICGYARCESGTITFSACYNRGSIYEEDDLGGIIGKLEILDSASSHVKVEECYSAAQIVYEPGKFPVPPNYYFGGVCGTIEVDQGSQNAIEITNCFWGKGYDSDQYPKKMIGNSNDYASGNRKFSASDWPAPAGAYWNVHPNGKWYQLGHWGGSAEGSFYPELSWQWGL